MFCFIILQSKCKQFQKNKRVERVVLMFRIIVLHNSIQVFWLFMVKLEDEQEPQIERLVYRLH